MDRKITLVVDSSSSLPRSAIERFGIHVLPFYYKFGANAYCREDINGGTDSFYQHMKEFPYDLPHTAAPNICDWCDLLEERYAAGGRQFLLMTISSALSGSYQNACAAKQELLEIHADIQLEVVDSCTCACGHAALELAAAKMIDAGKPFGEILEAVKSMRKAVTSLFSVHELTYMRAGGRIGGATAFIGQLVNIKPVCAFVGGVVKPIGAIPGRKRSIKYMVDHAIAHMGDPRTQLICVQNALYKEDADYLLDYFRSRTGYAGEIFHSALGIVVGSHSGPGAIGIGFVRNPLV